MHRENRAIRPRKGKEDAPIRVYFRFLIFHGNRCSLSAGLPCPPWFRQPAEMASQHHGKRHHDHHSNQRQHHSQSHQPPCLFFNQHGACRNGDATACSDGVHGRVTQVAVTELRLPLPTQVPPTASGPHSLIAQYESSRRAVAHFFIRQQTARDARVSRPLELGRAYWQDRLCVLPARLDCVAPKHGDSDSSAIEEKPDASSSSRADVPFSMTLLTVADVPVFARPALPVQLRQQEMRVTLNAPSLFPIVSGMRYFRAFLFLCLFCL